MTQLNDEHFEIIEKNKVERYERQKLTYLEDRVKVLETALESHAKILARFQMTEGVSIKAKKLLRTPRIYLLKC
jgi:hypothetical protein